MPLWDYVRSNPPPVPPPMRFTFGRVELTPAQIAAKKVIDDAIQRAMTLERMQAYRTSLRAELDRVEKVLKEIQ